MLQFRLLIFLSFAFFQSAYAKCTVIDQETKEPAHCVFPFRDKYDKFYTNCTNFEDPEERYWCSTKVSTYVSGPSLGFWNCGCRFSEMLQEIENKVTFE